MTRRAVTNTANKSAHGSLRAVCQWPGCHYWAVRWIRMGERMFFVALCSGHVEQFRSLSFVAVEATDFQPRRFKHRCVDND